MKNLILTLVIAFGSFAAMAQNPSVPARLGNRTACTLYVKLMYIDASCNQTLTTTYAVPPYTVILTAAPPAGSSYDMALVADTPSFNGSCYYQKVSVPWALCTAYPTAVSAAACCGPVIQSDWNLGGSSANPFLIMYN